MDWLKGDDETLLADAKLYATFKATANHIADGLMSGSHGHGCENHSDDEDNEDEDDEDYEDDDEDDDEDNDEDNDEEFGSDDLADLEEDMFYAFLDSFQDHFEGMYGNHGESESSDHDEDDDSLPDLIPMASEEDNDDILPDLVPIGTKEPTQATKTIPATKPKTAEQANTEKCGNQSTKHTIGSDTKAGNQEELDGDPYGFAFSDCEDDEWDGED